MSGFTTPNHTQVPNDLFALLPDMGEAELKVTLHAIRQTRGWQRDTDAISLSQFIKGTGLSRQGVLDGIAQAVERGTLVVHGHGKRGVQVFRLVYSVDQSIEQTSTGLDSRPDDAATGLLSRHTKERSTKETSKESVRASKSENTTPSKKVQPDQTAKTKTPPSSAPPPKDYDDVPKADRLDIIRAWATGLSIEPANAYSKEANHRSAAEIFRAGYRAPQVALFVKAKMQDSWWRGKTMTLDKVAELMPAYLQSLKPKQAISFEERKPLYPERERLSPEDIARRLAMKEQILAEGS